MKERPVPKEQQAADDKPRTVYVSHPASGLARSNFPLVCEVTSARIVR